MSRKRILLIAASSLLVVISLILYYYVGWFPKILSCIAGIVFFIGAVCSALMKSVPEIIREIMSRFRGQTRIRKLRIKAAIILKLLLRRCLACNSKSYWKLEEPQQVNESEETYLASAADIDKHYNIELYLKRRFVKKKEITHFFREKRMLRRGHFKFSEMYCSEIRFAIYYLLSLNFKEAYDLGTLLREALKEYQVNKLFYLERNTNFESPFISDLAEQVLGVDRIIPISKVSDLKDKEINQPDRILILEPHAHDDDLLQGVVDYIEDETKSVGAIFYGAFVIFSIPEFDKQELRIKLPS